MIRSRKFESLSDFNVAKPALPYPSVSKITDGDDTFVFFRHDSKSKPDTMTTVGESLFYVGWSVMGGPALLGSKE